MRFSQGLFPTLREAPSDATTPSHILLLRAGYIRMVGAGIYELLPLGFRVLSKISNIVREEMNRAGAQEVLMPALLPREYFEETGRWTSFGDTLLRLTDRKRGDYHLGPTHEEIITDMVRRDVKSYRQLPLNLYQIQMKFRDEARPRAGLLRCREFMMKDAYSFDTSEANALASYEKMRSTYHAIFQRLGLDYRVVAADTGAMGGSTSAEFQVLAQNGEDSIVACTKCDYAANVEVAPQVVAKRAVATNAPATKVATPGKKTIAEVAAFLQTTPERCVKCVVVVATDAEKSRVVMCLVRGDHEVNEVKLAKALSAKEIRMASDAEIFDAVKAPAGYLGPVGYQGELLVDHGVAALGDSIVGANEKGFHLDHVAFGRDYQGPLADIRQVGDGDPCPSCGGALKSYRGIEGGHIFVLGTHYSAKMKANFLGEDGVEKPMIMGCYGIGVSRLIATSVEQNHDADGICWPLSIAPYQAIVTTAGKGEELDAAAHEIYRELQQRGFEVLLDDRDERPGVKFKDADLIGIPMRIVVGAKALADGKVEFKLRREKQASLIGLNSVVAHVETVFRTTGQSADGS